MIAQRHFLRCKRVVILALSGMLLLVTSAFAEIPSTLHSIDFTATSGYGLESGRIMVQGIRVDMARYNPFTPNHPEIVVAYFNVPFTFDSTSMTLSPDLSALVEVNQANACAALDVHVSNAFTGEAIPNALVEVSGTTAYSDDEGLVHFSGVTNGLAQLAGSASGFVSTTRNVELACDETSSIGLAMSPSSGEGAISANEVRVILTWGEDPRDLDSHLTGPTASSTGALDDEVNRFHVYFSHKQEDVAVLDVDDVTSFGPETITISPPEGSETLRPGLYRYSIHHWAGESNITHSNASVTVQLGLSDSRTYMPPAGANGDNDVWTVFELLVDGSGNVSLYLINTFSPSVSASEVRHTSTGYGSIETGVDFSRLPSK
ncbi:MAG: hypothetical protein OET90_07150 [Desulfuromonadales bacterium]|nr:hypothetical protein [Desulfuromonadales bacterium]